MSRRKPVLVFDLDETLIYTSMDDRETIRSICINMKLLSLIYRAKQVGCTILLLTNNPNAVYTYRGTKGKFVDIACDELLIAYNAIGSSCKRGKVSSIFDSILTAEKDKERTFNVPNKYNYASPVKSLTDVHHMLKGRPAGDIYFFDDLRTHMLCKQSTFIHISPPFGTGHDATHYSPIVKALEELEAVEGSDSRTRRQKRKLKESRHGM
jgi:hypothetical protein